MDVISEKDVGIAIYVQQKYAKRNYKRDSYNKRVWPGISIIRDVLLKNGYKVDYCSQNTVNQYKIILVSLISPTDWFSFIEERVMWKPGSYTVIVGGAGNLNVRPFLDYADVFVFGRGESIILDLVESILKDDRLDHPSVLYSYDAENMSDYFETHTHFIQQADMLYPYTVELANKELWQERSIGCQHKCLFCAYSFHRNRTGVRYQSDSGIGHVVWKGSEELTILELDLDHPETWAPPTATYLIFGLDGLSERLRFIVNKPISNDRFVKFLHGCAKLKNIARVKLYCVVGYPTETDDDWYEFKDVIQNFDKQYPYPGYDPLFAVELQVVPFKAMPATPAAVWPMRYFDYRGYATKILRDKAYLQKHTIMRGNAVRLYESFFVESLPHIVTWALAIRGLEEDAEIIKEIATNKRLQNSSNKVQLATFEKYLDIDRLFGEYSWDNVPTKYLKTYVPDKALQKLSRRIKEYKYVRREVNYARE